MQKEPENWKGQFLKMVVQATPEILKELSDTVFINEELSEEARKPCFKCVEKTKTKRKESLHEKKNETPRRNNCHH